jgi:hypothetical protein
VYFVVRVPVVTGVLASIAINAAPQYSVSFPSVTWPVEESVVTILQNLQSLSDVQEVAAQAIKRNEAPNNSFLFIGKIFHFKDTKTLFLWNIINPKR